MNIKQTPTVIGIDVGAFSAKIAAVQRGTIDVITNQANFRQTPMVIGYGDAERKIGQIGNVKLKSNFKNTVTSANRYLGLKADGEQAKKQLMHCPCQTKIQNDRVLFKVQNNEKQENFTSEQVMASFMTKLSDIINHNNLDDKMIVFSVPSYFTEIQKKSLLNAAQISGSINVRLVTQSVAIGLDYGNDKKSEFAEGKNVIFVDFGHSKLTASVVKFTESKMEVLLEKYNRNLGCRDIDLKVFNYMAKKFQQKTGLDIHENKRACLKLIQTIQRQRKILSGVSQTDISIQCLMEDEDISQPFTRVIMYSEAAQIFNQISTLLISLKEDINKLGIKIDSIQLVGGGSRIPKIIDLIEQHLEMSTSRTINSSQTIARGATLYAVQQSGLFRINCFDVINRSAHTAKLDWKQVQENMNETETASANSQDIILVNETIPCQKTLKISTTSKIEAIINYTTVDSQIEQKIATILIQEPSVDELNMKFIINQDGFIKLESITDNSGKIIKFSIKSSKLLTVQQISAFKLKEKEMFIKDFSIVKSYEKKNELEAFIYKQKQVFNNQQLKKYLTKQQVENAQKLLNDVAQLISNSDTQMSVKDFEDKKVQIQNEIKKLLQTSKKRKGEILLEIKKLEDLKAHADDTMKQITQRFRNTQKVVQTYNQIKQISQWSTEAIKATKDSNISEISAVSQKDIQQQYENIKILVNQLVNPQRVQPHPQPQPRNFQPQHENYMNQTAKPQQRQQQQQQQKRRAPQNFDPFGMSRSGFFGPSSNMFGFF